MATYVEGAPGQFQWLENADTTFANHTAQIAAGDVTNPASAAGVAMGAAFDRVFKPKAYGAIGDGVTDDTAAVRAAFDAANAAARAGLTATIFHPGATVVLDGKYNLATLTAAITVTCNVRGGAAALIAPTAYAGTVLLVGHGTSGSILQNADIVLPDVIKVGAVSLTAGSIGTKVQNLYNSNLTFGRTAYFETGIHFTGLGNGTVYNRVFIGWLSYVKVALKLSPSTGGWVNQNTFLAGGIQQSPSFDGGGTRRAGWKHVLIDGQAINSVNGNTFVGVAFEGDCSEFTLDFFNAIENVFIGCRFEQGTLGAAVAVAGATLTATAHGLTVGNVVTFAASAVPTGMVSPSPYYVASITDANTFTVSQKKGGTAITFGSSGTSVTFFRPPTIRFDGTGGNCFRNIIEHPEAPLGLLEQIIVSAASDNLVRIGGRATTDIYAADDAPLHRARNSFAGARRPAFAAYPPSVNPTENPNGWTTAISDRGVTFAETEAESGRVFTAAGGILKYQRPADAVSFEIASATRSPGTLAVTSLTVPLQATATTTVSLSNVAINDHVVVTPAAALPSGIVIAYARVTAAGVVTVGFANITGADIILTTTVQVVAFRRYY